MGCFHPLLAVDLGIGSDGKHKIKILPKRVDYSIDKWRVIYGDSLMTLPCGKCAGCMSDYSRQWAARIMMESKYYTRSCFLTLTYRGIAPEKPNKHHLRQFIKKIRNEFGKGIKFFGCGELGSNTHRSHYHLILFGVDFEDKIPVVRSGDYVIYESKQAEHLWNRGFISLGDLSIASASYVAQYCVKKKLHDNDSGEFVIMSRGLGSQYFEEHKTELFKSDFISIDGQTFKFPRYFLKLADKDSSLAVNLDGLLYKELKRDVATSIRFDAGRSVTNEDEGLIHSERIYKDKLIKKTEKRGIDL